MIGSPPWSINIHSALSVAILVPYHFCLQVLMLSGERFVALSVLSVNTFYFVKQHPKQGEGGGQALVKGGI